MKVRDLIRFGFILILCYRFFNSKIKEQREKSSAYISFLENELYTATPRSPEIIIGLPKKNKRGNFPRKIESPENRNTFCPTTSLTEGSKSPISLSPRRWSRKL